MRYHDRSHASCLTPHASGFTLIELMVVIAIIGILSAGAIAGVNIARSKARDAKRSANVAQIQKALALLVTNTGSYPVATDGTCLTDADAVSQEIKDRGFMKSIPPDPSGATAPPPVQPHCIFYTSADGATYTIQFSQERTTSRGPVGTITVSP